MKNYEGNKEKKYVQIGLLGLGVVGSGVVKVVHENQDLIKERTGYQIEIPYILVRDRDKKRNVTVPSERLITEYAPIIDSPELSIVVEVMGGIEPARTIILHALRSKKHVITANKELMAKHGEELIQTANEAGVQLLFEASVAGGIPIIRFLQGYLTANQVQEITGILNGTTNYILSQMDQTGQPFADALAQAQELGYAEADPKSDVEGFDAAYKLAILTNLAYDTKVSVHQIARKGISEIQPLDLEWARQCGYVIKVLGSSRKTEQGIELSVGPCFLPISHSLTRVNGVFNAVTILSDVVGEITLVGKGAGEFPTASAVIEDLTALLRKSGSVLRSSNWDSSTLPCSETNFRSFFLRLVCLPSQINQVEQHVNQYIETCKGQLRHRLKNSEQEGVLGWIIDHFPRQKIQILLQQLEGNQWLEKPPLILPCLEERNENTKITVS